MGSGRVLESIRAGTYSLRTNASPTTLFVRAHLHAGLTWIIGMVSGDGGWAAFDADNTSRLVAKLPFCDFGAVTDPPSADVTAHVVEALAAMGQAGSRAARRGVVWLLGAQESDGSWFGRWGANYIYGTGATVSAPPQTQPQVTPGTSGATTTTTATTPSATTTTPTTTTPSATAAAGSTGGTN